MLSRPIIRSPPHKLMLVNLQVSGPTGYFSDKCTLPFPVHEHT